MDDLKSNDLAESLHSQRIKEALNLDSFLDYVEEMYNISAGSEIEIKKNMTEMDQFLESFFNSGKRKFRRRRNSDDFRTSETDDSIEDMYKDVLDRRLADDFLSDSGDSEIDRGPVTDEEIKHEMKLLFLRKKYQAQALRMGLQNCRKKCKRRKLMISRSNKIKETAAKKELTPEEVRRKIWVTMVKKEIPKVQRSRLNRIKEIQTSNKKIAHQSLKYWRQRASLSQKYSKDVVWRTKRLTKEMQVYWKRYERVERETRKRQEREAEEQRKLDVEFMEVKRQQRKLNFLITQTELYAHFMSKKLGHSTDEEGNKILDQLNEDNSTLLEIDDYDCDEVKRQIHRNVLMACEADKLHCRQFEKSTLESSGTTDERPQPAMFAGQLKHYQLNGMNWLANLYDQGINGILADEMGLGKTIQSIAFLCHIAEKYSIWGPFLVISPSSTLHNWQQEIARFSPDFKVVPYWGNPQERKILRQFWDLKELHTKNASFHVVITSYQLIITDFKYFNRIKWEYLILDEAQAIKSSSSMRWKILLGFKCRNRLLLSGTPIQNSMAELWALLHFIMPSMFDSHNEFNEWFSKDIESHAENKTNIDEKHLSRLHSILKPFMLRRVKKDVENELSDKIEIMMYCPLTSRQRLLYSTLRKKISIDDLLHTSGAHHSQMITSNLLNLVMQFRKVCNHPELFERREPTSPFFFKIQQPIIPQLFYDQGIMDNSLLNKQHLLIKIFNIFTVQHILHRSNEFSFSKFLNLSTQELCQIFTGGLITKWLDILQNIQKKQISLHRDEWCGKTMPLKISLIFHKIGLVPDWLIFTSHRNDECVFSFGTEKYFSMPETIEHRLMRSLKKFSGPVLLEDDLYVREKSSKDIEMLPEFPYQVREPFVLECLPTFLPKFLYEFNSKVQVNSIYPYCYSRRFAWFMSDYKYCYSDFGLNCVTYGDPDLAEVYENRSKYFHSIELGGLMKLTPRNGWSNIRIPNKQNLITDSGKLFVLDGLLKRLKEEGHRVLIYSQMTKMIDLLEEYMCFRNHRYMRLDGSSKISDRRDMVEDFQVRAEIFVFLLSTRAGGVGINLTAADTVIFYDSDWNPTVDQQAMDRTHRLGQTKQVTVYRLICKDTIEDRILQRAREKSEIQRMVISDGVLKQDMLKPKEVVSILLDDEDIEKKYRQKQLELRYSGRGGDGKRKLKDHIVENNDVVDSNHEDESSSEYNLGLYDEEEIDNGGNDKSSHSTAATTTKTLLVRGGAGGTRKRGRAGMRNIVSKSEISPDSSTGNISRKRPRTRGRGRARRFGSGGKTRR